MKKGLLPLAAGMSHCVPTAASPPQTHTRTFGTFIVRIGFWAGAHSTIPIYNKDPLKECLK